MRTAQQRPPAIHLTALLRYSQWAGSLRCAQHAHRVAAHPQPTEPSAQAGGQTSSRQASRTGSGRRARSCSSGIDHSRAHHSLPKPAANGQGPIFASGWWLPEAGLSVSTTRLRQGGQDHPSSLAVPVTSSSARASYASIGQPGRDACDQRKVPAPAQRHGLTCSIRSTVRPGQDTRVVTARPAQTCQQNPTWRV